MKIAVLSDTHDNIWKLEAALELMEEAECLIHCGDLCSPFVIRKLGKGARSRPVHVVWGNNEGDIRLICNAAREFSDFHLHGALAELEIDGIRIAVNHYPEIARPLATAGTYDLVCYGHDHRAYREEVGSCLLLNPGELMGLNGRTTFAVFDTRLRRAEIVEV